MAENHAVVLHSKGWIICREFADQASGKRSDREQFQAMFVGASRREFDLVLFWSLDRFSREGVYETLQHLQRLTLMALAIAASASRTWIPAVCSRTR